MISNRLEIGDSLIFTNGEIYTIVKGEEGYTYGLLSKDLNIVGMYMDYYLNDVIGDINDGMLRYLNLGEDEKGKNKTSYLKSIIDKNTGKTLIILDKKYLKDL